MRNRRSLNVAAGEPAVQGRVVHPAFSNNAIGENHSAGQCQENARLAHRAAERRPEQERDYENNGYQQRGNRVGEKNVRHAVTRPLDAEMLNL